MQRPLMMRSISPYCVYRTTATTLAAEVCVTQFVLAESLHLLARIRRLQGELDEALAVGCDWLPSARAVYGLMFVRDDVALAA